MSDDGRWGVAQGVVDAVRESLVARMDAEKCLTKTDHDGFFAEDSINRIVSVNDAEGAQRLLWDLFTDGVVSGLTRAEAIVREVLE